MFLETKTCLLYKNLWFNGMTDGQEQLYTIHFNTAGYTFNEKNKTYQDLFYSLSIKNRENIKN